MVPLGRIQPSIALFFWQAAQELDDTKAVPRRQPLPLAPRQGRAITATQARHYIKPACTRSRVPPRRPKPCDRSPGISRSPYLHLGIIGTGLLSIPVLAGSAAYAIGEARRWPVGLAREPLQAKAFYGAIALATLLGAAANMLSLNAVKALIWSVVINGIVGVPVIALLMPMSANKLVRGSSAYRSAGRPSAGSLQCGVFELLGAAGLLYPPTRRVAGVGLVALTLAVTPAPIYMLQRPNLFDVPLPR
jgi:hypothetical protein